jgi:hypothetical protein
MPPNEKSSAPCTGRSPSSIIQSSSRRKYHAQQWPQVWTREARRLAGLFAESGNWTHCAALFVHVAGMNWRLGGCKSAPPRKEILLRVQERP